MRDFVRETILRVKTDILSKSFLFVIFFSLVFGVGKTAFAKNASKLHCIDIVSQKIPHELFVNPASITNSFDYTNTISKQTEELLKKGYTQLEAHQPLPKNKVNDIVFMLSDVDIARSPSAMVFLGAIQLERSNLKRIYGLSDIEYVEIARLSLGILNMESRFGYSLRYLIKELFPSLITVLKKIKNNHSQNSKGLTQIKMVPRSIRSEYQITGENLNDPYLAAIATIGFLADALAELKGKLTRYTVSSINDDNYFEHLIYIYNGRVSQLINDTSTPDKNIYIQSIRLLRPKLLVYYH